MTSTYTPPPALIRAGVSSSPSRTWRWWWFAASALVLALIAGSTVGVLKYFSSRYPNTAERALLDQVPLALTTKNTTCNRNGEAEQDTTNVEASVVCTPSDDDINKVVFTKYTSSRALATGYQGAVAAAGSGESPGDCRSADRAQGTYTGEADQASGRILCYQDRGSSFVAWTDDRAHTLGQATRVDPDYMKLRDWWAGVVGLPTSAQTEAQAQAQKQVADAKKQANEAKQQADDALKQQAAEAKKQADDDQKQIADAKQQAQNGGNQGRDNSGSGQDNGGSGRNNSGSGRDNDGSGRDNDGSGRNNSGSGKSDSGSGRGNGGSGKGDSGSDQGNGGSGIQQPPQVNVGGQDLQQLIADAVKLAIQQRGLSGREDLQRQIEDSVRKSIQQQGNAAGGQNLQQLINDAIKLALAQAQQNGR
ncbi:MAG: hypothetical protein ACRDR6_25275 [Pseudonocardiaceae bacterium]